MTCDVVVATKVRHYVVRVQGAADEQDARGLALRGADLAARVVEVRVLPSGVRR